MFKVSLENYGLRSSLRGEVGSLQVWFFLCFYDYLEVRDDYVILKT